MDVPLQACVFDTSSWTFAGVYCGARVSSDAGGHDGPAGTDGGQAWLCRSMVPLTGNTGTSGAGQECSPQKLGVLRIAEP